MPVFRVEKEKNYTVMCNYHLQDQSLTLKAKGLLSQILSLPDDWDYTLRGLASINKESVNTIGGIVNELIAAGYIIREQSRGGAGQFATTEYVIFEHPQKEVTETAEEPENKTIDMNVNTKSAENKGIQPCHKKRDTDNRDTEKPYTDSCDNNKILNKQNTKKQNINIYNHQSYPSSNFISVIPERKNYEQYHTLVLQNISYDALVVDHKDSVKQIDGIVNIIMDVIMTKKNTIRIAGEDKPAEVVKAKFLKLNKFNIDYVLDSLTNNTSLIKNMIAYVRTSLYNAPDTEELYYTNQVNNYMYGQREGP